MRYPKPWRLMAAVFVLALGLVAANAGAQNLSSFTDTLSPAASAQAADHDTTWLRITAFTDVPLTRATVRVYDTFGRLLYERHRATNNQGAFPSFVRELPRDFRVTVVSRGDDEEDQDDDRDQGEESGASSLRRVKLSADVQNFDPVRGIVFVNPVTTIVSRLLDRFPQLNLQQAQALVRLFLGLPANASLGLALRESNGFHSLYFSETTFLTEAAQYGGINPFIEVLVSKAVARPLKRHLFPPAQRLGGIGSFIARNLVSGALSWAGGQGAGWVAQSAGLTTPGATAAQINNLQSGLLDLQSSVDQLSKQVASLQSELSAQITQAELNAIVIPANSLAITVNGIENDLTYYAQACPTVPEGTTPPPPDPYCSNPNTRTSILNQLNDSTTQQAYGVLAGYLLDNSTIGATGILHLFSQSLGQNVHFFRPADSTKIQNMFDYWDGAETQAANLKVELLHLNNAQDNPVSKKQLTDFLGDVTLTPPTTGTFQDTHNREAALIYPPVPQGTVIDTKTRLMWKTDYDIVYPLCEQNQPHSNWNAPYTQPVSWNNLSGFVSPSLSELQALIAGWSGANPSAWLADQTKAVAPDSPTDAGFANVVYASTSYDPFNHCTNNPSVWTTTASPPYNLYGVNYPADYSINFTNGTAAITPLNFSGPFYIWVYIRRPLVGNERYYWYP